MFYSMLLEMVQPIYLFNHLFSQISSEKRKSKDEIKNRWHEPYSAIVQVNI